MGAPRSGDTITHNAAGRHDMHGQGGARRRQSVLDGLRQR